MRAAVNERWMATVADTAAAEMMPAMASVTDSSSRVKPRRFISRA